MRDSEKYASMFWTEITKRYVQAAMEGCTDIAIILSLKNQVELQRSIAEQTGQPHVPSIGAVFRIGNRASLAIELNTLEPGNIAAVTLAKEIPPEGMFPLIVVMDEGANAARIDFLYSAKPPLPVYTYGQRVYGATRERTEVEYLKALKRGVLDPVILVDTRNQEERKERIARDRPMPENMEVAHVAILTGSRSEIASKVSTLCRDAATGIMEGPVSGRPFTVVILGGNTAEVFNEPFPVAGEGI